MYIKNAGNLTFYPGAALLHFQDVRKFAGCAKARTVVNINYIYSTTLRFFNSGGKFDGQWPFPETEIVSFLNFVVLNLPS